MFKRNSKEKPTPPAAKQPSEQELAIERAVTRGQRLSRLSQEAAMWRAFAGVCKAGRVVRDEVGYVMSWIDPRKPPSISVDIRQLPQQTLHVVMDEDSAKQWAEFAMRMAEERETRLRDVLAWVD